MKKSTLRESRLFGFHTIPGIEHFCRRPGCTGLSNPPGLLSLSTFRLFRGRSRFCTHDSPLLNDSIYGWSVNQKTLQKNIESRGRIILSKLFLGKAAKLYERKFAELSL